MDIKTLKEILRGIDETEDKDGWWETSTGAEFGKRKKEELLAAIKDLFIECVGEDYNHREKKINLDCEKDEYWCCPDCLQDSFKNQAKSEIRSRINKMFE